MSKVDTISKPMVMLYSYISIHPSPTVLRIIQQENIILGTEMQLTKYKPTNLLLIYTF